MLRPVPPPPPPAPATRVEPALPQRDRAAATYAPVAGQLFVDGADFDDPLQGELGDCPLVAALSAVAERHPQMIDDMVHANADGTYTVRFFEYPGDGNHQRKPVNVTVDGALPVENGKPVYGTSRSGELWPSIVEKAAASLNGHGYEGLENEAVTLGDVVGSSWWLGTRSVSPDALFAQIQQLDQAGKAMVARTYDLGDRTAHAYAVLGAVERNGEKFIRLRNPWGEDPGSDDGSVPASADGVVEVPLQLFVNSFESIDHEL